MTARLRVLPYRQGSRSARALADALGGRVLRLEGSRFRPRPRDVIINWGNTNDYQRATINAVDLRQVTNKLNFFNLMALNGLEDIVPNFWTNQQEIPDEAFPIVCRTVLAGHSGDGIVIAADRSELVPAPLYVQYVKKSDEYRIHVGRDNRDGESIIIAAQRKARRRDVPDEEVNWQVRNHHNGFVFVRGDVNPPSCVLDSARRALEVSGLDFGAVDVIYNERQGRAYVLEINTAPGLEGQTIDDYARFFQQF